MAVEPAFFDLLNVNDTYFPSFYTKESPIMADKKAMKQVDIRKEEDNEKLVKFYSSKHQMLLVGEGDFSFSWCLARSFGSACKIVASSLDSYADLYLNVVIQKYKKARSNLEDLEKLGACILHGVDVKKMKHHFALRMLKFDRIIFNFPHAGFNGKEDRDIVIEKHKELVGNFFGSANDMLQADGEIHVTHKTTPPFCDWNILELARRNSLELIERVDFKIGDYPGYSNKRGAGNRCDESFPLGECSTFKFRSFCTAKKTYGVTSNSGSALKRSWQLQGNRVEMFKRQRIAFDRGISQTSFSMNSKDFSDYSRTPLAVNIRTEGASTLETCSRAITHWGNPVSEVPPSNFASYVVNSQGRFMHDPYMLHGLHRINQPFSNWDSSSQQREMVLLYGQHPQGTSKKTSWWSPKIE
ncbi:unnamed protein product [Dovyalis caffra]|uniref:25S rRNA (uridine-N(3))-methyltransferase BMT5-like domain-containing protein n=1 Tax=Dovyalis caffra TaxID=77055 RepID=A0AAV1S722_9ROSI|nr:unnamed protein product [Dovyalis caffra]